MSWCSVTVQHIRKARYYGKLFCRSTMSTSSLDSATNNSPQANADVNATAAKNIKSLLTDFKNMETNKRKLKRQFRSRNDRPKYPPASVYLRVVGTGAPGAPRSLYVFTGQSSYMFNCGEGTQRLAYENKVKLAGLQNVLITHKSWANVGGLLGMLLTLQGAGMEEILLHGPPGIHILYHETRKMALFRGLRTACQHYTTNGGVYGDQGDPLTITAVPIWPIAGQEGPAKDDVTARDSTEECESQPESECDSESPTDEDLGAPSSEHEGGTKRPSEEELEGTSNRKRPKSEEFTTTMAMAYICKVAPKMGMLHIEACARAGVPPGPLLGKLKSGQDVTLPSGVTVRSRDVREPDDPGPTFLVVEAPSIGHMHNLVTHPAFLPHQSGADAVAEVVVHFTSDALLQHPLYQQWMNGFPSTTSHILINEGNKCTGSESIHRMQYKLNYLDAKVFPKLSDTSIPSVEDRTTTAALVSPAAGVGKDGKALHKVVRSVTSMIYNLRPRTQFDMSLCPALDMPTILTDIKQSGCPQSLLDGASTGPSEYPVITFLGTGSSMPSKTRNVSGIMVEVEQDCHMLLDCGEGTYGQLARLHGLAGAQNILCNLKGIYVSHMHADHHMGLINILVQRRQALQGRGIKVEPILLLAPHTIRWYLASYDRNFEDIADDYYFLDNSEFYANHHNVDRLLGTSVCQVLHVAKISTCNVDHCVWSYGVTITTNGGKKLTYSGDTRSCSRLMELGKDSDILIHEATFEDELSSDASVKKHCTVSQALEVGTIMKAKHVILNHFSQRYSKMPILPEHFKDTTNVALAYDLMTVRLSDFPRIASLHTQLAKMFADDLDQVKSKTLKRQLDLDRDEHIMADRAKAKR